MRVTTAQFGDPLTKLRVAENATLTRVGRVLEVAASSHRLGQIRGGIAYFAAFAIS